MEKLMTAIIAALIPILFQYPSETEDIDVKEFIWRLKFTFWAVLISDIVLIGYVIHHFFFK